MINSKACDDYITHMKWDVSSYKQNQSVVQWLTCSSRVQYMVGSGQNKHYKIDIGKCVGLC
jgi:hypothetical protein